MMTKKIIQTEVDRAVYDFVLKTAESKGLTLKEATRQALEDWAAREGDLSWDPLFDPKWVGRPGKPTDAARLDEILYGRKKR